MELAGDELALAERLKVTPSHLALWLAAIERPPMDIFLRAVDLVVGEEVSRLNRPGNGEPNGRK